MYFINSPKTVSNGFRCASTRCCPGEDLVANHSLLLGFDCTWGFLDPLSTISGNFSV